MTKKHGKVESSLEDIEIFERARKTIADFKNFKPKAEPIIKSSVFDKFRSNDLEIYGAYTNTKIGESFF